MSCRLLQTTKDLCSIKSWTGKNCLEDIVSVCQKRLPSDTSLSLRQSASPGASGDILLTRQGSGSGKLLLLGHYDTVPIESKITRQADRLFAPGSYDMKGGIAIALELASWLDKNSFEKIDLYLAGDEEWRARPLALAGRWDAVLAFEGGDPGGLVSSRFGAGILQIDIHGESLRATHPAGKHSIRSLAQLLLELESQNRQKAHFTPSNIRSASAINVIAKTSTTQGILRYHSEAELNKFLEQIPTTADGLPVSTSFQELIPEMRSTRESESLIESVGLRPISRTGSSDISFLAAQAPVAIDGLGPLGGDEHSEKEYILASSLEQRLALCKTISTEILWRLS